MHFELRLAPLGGSGLLWGCSGPALGSSGVLWPPLACSGLLWGSGWLPLFPGAGPERGMQDNFNRWTFYWKFNILSSGWLLWAPLGSPGVALGLIWPPLGSSGLLWAALGSSGAALGQLGRLS